MAGIDDIRKETVDAEFARIGRNASLSGMIWWPNYIDGPFQHSLAPPTPFQAIPAELCCC